MTEREETKTRYFPPYWPLAVLWVGLMWYCKLAQQHIITVVYSLRKGVGWIICYKSVWLDAGFENWNSQWGQIFKMFTLAFYLPRFFFKWASFLVLQTINNSKFKFSRAILWKKLYLFDWLKNFNVTKKLFSTNQSLLFGGVQKLRWHVFGFFWPPTHLRLHFLWYESLQKVDFFDHLPPSSCKRSLWTAP